MSVFNNFALRGPLRQSSLADKDLDMSSVERDAGFCSGGDDEEEELEDLHSPTDASEDSVEVKVEPISLRNKNKRKCAEPRKVASTTVDADTLLQPYKKRRHYLQDAITVLPDNHFHLKQAKEYPHMVKESSSALVCPRSTLSPFRPWSNPAVPERSPSTPKRACPSTVVSPPPLQYMERVPELPNQEEPLSLVLKTSRSESKSDERRTTLDVPRPTGTPMCFDPRTVVKSEFPIVKSLDGNMARLEVPGYEQRRFLTDSSGSLSDARRLHYASRLELKVEPGCSQTVSRPYTMTRPVDDRIQEAAVNFSSNPGPSRTSDPVHCRVQRGRMTLSELATEDRVDESANKSSVEDCAGPSTSSTPDKKQSPTTTAANNQQRNYKNMTRERRVEANARERTRVHTISAAFDTLRRTIPAYSHNQKLSKLSVLRIACSYILTLSRVAGNDYSADGSEPSLADCVDYVSRTIQTEGKLRKKKDE